MYTGQLSIYVLICISMYPKHIKHIVNYAYVLELPSDVIDMIDDFTVDPMHCIYQNAVRRFLNYLVAHLKSRKSKLSGTTWYKIGQLFASSKFPREFSRPARDFRHFDMWKATEQRMFCLYGGDEVLATVFETDDDEEGGGIDIPTVFRKLSLAIRILSDNEAYKTHNKIASQLLDSYLEDHEKLFGESSMKLAIHQLSHLAQDSLRLGPLDSYSAFQFENTLKTIKV